MIPIQLTLLQRLSQLEAKLKVWNIRKNLSKVEWNAILYKLDEIDGRLQADEEE